MRIPRLLSILGPVAVLYVLAARASLQLSSSHEGLVAVLSLALSLTPLLLLSAPARRGTSRLAFMGICLALAVASARAPSISLDRTHAMAWLCAVLVTLDLAFPRGARPLVRYGLLAGLMGAAIVGAALAESELLPAATLGVIVVIGIIGAGAFHLILLVRRGHTVEGALSGIALVGLAVGLAYTWFGPFAALLAISVEFAAASLLWLGHLAWLDPHWRSLRSVGIPFLAACVISFAIAYTLVPWLPPERWELGVAAAGFGVVWGVSFSGAKRLANRSVWTTAGRLIEAANAARRGLAAGAGLEEIAIGVLAPFAEALGIGNDLPELYSLEPPLRIRLDVGERPNIRSADPPAAITRAVFAGHQQDSLDILSLRRRVVREPAIRDVVETMEGRGIGCVVPCVHLDHVEGLLLLPWGDRSEPLSRLEHNELARLGESLGVAFASALTQRRADTHIHELSSLRRQAEDRVTALESELEQLREQCDLLGRGLAEDQTLHVAYSPSMRRVQTRAIELAPEAGPVFLIAPAGAPVLPISRFIHDRGPRWRAPFIVADCSAASPQEVMSLLFGSAPEHRKGWLQSATGGTLLLRDLPALPRAVQARLASALAEHEDEPADVRIIGTSRKSLDQLRRRDALDPDLVRRLARSEVSIPSLRERREDVPSLALLAIDRACRVLGREPVGIEQSAMEALAAHDWPGDVAELEFIIELAVARARGKTITLPDLPPLAWPAIGEEDSLEGTYEEVECRLLERALLRAGGNKSEAARMLGLKRTTFLDKLRRHGLEKYASERVRGSAVG